MEGLFRTDLSGVRVHVGPEAATLGALAFTHRTDIYFAPGQYAPHSPHGERLLAHELTHVVQQRAGRVRCPAGSGAVVVHDLGLEAEAERMSALASSFRAAPVPPLQARLAAPPPPRPVAASPAVPTPAVQPFGLWLAGKILDWTDPHWRERGNLIRRKRETWELYESLPGSVKSRPKVKQWADQLKNIDPAQADPSTYVNVGNEIGNIASWLQMESELASRLDAARTHFVTHGTSHLGSRPDWLSIGIREDLWSSLTNLGRDIPNVKRKARQGNDRALASLVEYLFQRFIAAGFRYNIMQDSPAALIGPYIQDDSPEGNCSAYALTFANVLISFGIDAELKTVRGESKGRFIVKLDRFIDPRVRGHIYIKKVLQTGYYMFTSHAATWVPSAGKYYDPMACASYRSLDPYLECNIESSKDEREFRPSTPPRTLAPHRHWKLVRPEVPDLPGGFARLNLVEDV